MEDIAYILFKALGFAFSYGPLLVALILGFALPAIVVLASLLAKRFSDHALLLVIFGCILIGSALSVATSGRVIYSQEYLQMNPLAAMEVERGGGSAWFSRLAHFLLLVVSISVIFSWATRERSMTNRASKVWFWAMLYFFMTIVVSGVLGVYRDVELRVIYAPIVFTAVALLASSVDVRKLLLMLRWLLFVPLLGSLCWIFLSPGLVMESGYSSLIPGLTIRLAGLTEHANSLGMLALVALCLEFSNPERRANVFLVLVASANLLLAQSKTMWVAAAVAGVLYFYYKFYLNASRIDRGVGVVAIACFSCFSLAIVVAVLFGSMDRIVDLFVTDTTGLITFTGRTKIWEITLDEFFKSPLYGYGPSLWDVQFRYEKGVIAAGQAHNQLIQTLGQAGVFGVVSLFGYVAVLFSASVRAAKMFNGFSVVLLVVLLIRCFSESPMRMVGILDPSSFVHLLIFFMAAIAEFCGGVSGPDKVLRSSN